jgi:DNA mismatch repair protein MutH
MHDPLDRVGQTATDRELGALLRHAQALVGVTLGELADGLGLPIPVGSVRTKGWSGQIVERELGVSTSGLPGPDFASLGIELKTVPVDGSLAPLESTAVCHIDPVGIAAESWESSAVRRKLARVLFIALEVLRRSAPVGDRRVIGVALWRPSAEEERLLRDDFELFIREYFRLGRGAEITGHQGQALQVRPKGRNAADRRAAFGPDGRPVQIGRSGFYLRPAFVGRILRYSVRAL